MAQALGRQPQDAAFGEHVFERVLDLARLNWLLVSALAIGVVGMAMRFWDLGSRALHHDESLHATYSWYLYTGRGYTHDPLMHGPWQFHANALIFFLFGDTDFTVRIQYVLAGTALMLLPFLLRDYLSRPGALIATFLLAISPTMFYYSRFAREDMPFAVWTLLLVVGLWGYLRQQQLRYLIVTAIATSLGFLTKESQYITVAVFGSFLTGYLLWQLAPTGVPKLDALRRNPVFGLCIVLGTLTLPLLSAFARFTPLIKTDTIPFGLGPWQTTPAIASQFFVVIGLVLISAAVGLWWNARIWPIVAAAFYAPFLLLQTTFFTNLAGVGSGMYGALNYWLDQQGVARGEQPKYYYALLLPLYEFLPILLVAAGLVFYARRRDLITPFTAFVAYWFLAAFAGYTVAGEKMPWLAVHLALPLILFAARSSGLILRGVDWRLAFRWPVVGAVLLFILAVIAAGAALGSIVSPGTPTGTDLMYRTILLGGVALLLAAGGVQLSSSLGGRWAAGAASAAVVAVLVILTIRVAVTVSYRNGDTATEMLIYTQTTPDIPRIAREIEAISLRTTGTRDLKISVDSTSGFTWPWAWYLRNYPNVDYPNLANGAPAQGAVVLVHANNVERMRPFLTDFTSGVRYRHRWWFPEDYKTPIEWIAAMGSPIASQQRPNGSFTFADALQATFSPSGLDTIWRYFFNRDLGKPLSSEDAYLFIKLNAAATDPNAALQPPRGPSATDDYAAKRIAVQPASIVGSKGVAPGQLTDPKGAAYDLAGNLYVVDSGNNRVQKFDPTGQLVAQTGSKGAANGQFTEPWGIAVAPDGTIWVADTWNHRLQQFSPDLQFLRVVGQFGEVGTNIASGGGSFYGPRSIAFLPDGSFLVTDTGNKRVQRFSAAGTFLSAFGGQGAQPGQFQEPVGLAVAPDGTVYVADTWNRRIQAFDPSLRPIGSIPLKGWESTGILNKPYLAVDPLGTIYATDPENHRLLRFGPDGQLLAVFGQIGTQPGQFNLPIGLAIDPAGTIAVVESGGSRIQRFAPIP